MDDAWYTFHRHRQFLLHFVERHIIADSTPRHQTVCIMQDWGAFLGLTFAFPPLFSHLFVMNTALCTGSPPSEGWLAFRDFIARSPDLKVGAMLGRGAKHMTQREKDAYDAPFPNQAAKVSVKLSQIASQLNCVLQAAVRRFPQIVPVRPDMPGVAESKAAAALYSSLTPSSLKVFIAVGMTDPVLGDPVMSKLATALYSSTGYFYFRHAEGGHFLQEWGEALMAKCLDAFAGSQVEGAVWVKPVTTTLAKL